MSKKTAEPKSEEQEAELNKDEKLNKDEELPLVDLSQLMPERWPGNSVERKATLYVDIEELTLETNQTGKLVQTPEGFVLERIDLAALKAPVMDMALKFATDEHDLASFTLSSDSEQVSRAPVTGMQAGDYLPGSWINLVNLGSRPEGSGRLAVSIIGYLIEPWR